MGLGEIKKKTKETFKDIKNAANEPVVPGEEAHPKETKTEKTTTKTPTGEHHVEKKKTTETY